MSGGITQLVAIGAQDVHLVGNPEVSFFRTVYKRHTNFSQLVDRQTIQGNPSSGGISTVRFERKGDMLGYVYLTKKNGSTSNVFDNSDISKVELLIGGQVIDEQDNTFTSNIADPLLVSTTGKAATQPQYFYPLHFFFCEHYQSALPLVALQYHDVELRITWNTPIASDRYECWANFIYLDNMERQEMASKKHDMLIYQVQKSPGSGATTQELNFNHPVKFLASSSNIVGTALTSTLKLQINGVDVGEQKTYDPHFNRATYYHHAPYSAAGQGYGDGFLYPFCLDTNKLQPTGTLNFSRIDTARLVSDSTILSSVNIYGVNYNILRIQNGMGGLMYAN